MKAHIFAKTTLVLSLFVSIGVLAKDGGGSSGGGNFTGLSEQSRVVISEYLASENGKDSIDRNKKNSKAVEFKVRKELADVANSLMFNFEAIAFAKPDLFGGLPLEEISQINIKSID